MSGVYKTSLGICAERSIAMVYTDNKVALRQLDIANAALDSRESLRSNAQLASGLKSMAKDGKFHPRVLTLVRNSVPLLQGC